MFTQGGRVRYVVVLADATGQAGNGGGAGHRFLWPAFLDKLLR